MRGWLAQHRRALLTTLQRLSASPLATLLNAAVMGIALSLPAGGWLLLHNLTALAGQASAEPEISIFLEPAAERSDAKALEARLRGHRGVRQFEFIPRERALETLSEQADLGDVAEVLGGNPLPDAFVVRAADADPAALEKLREEFAGWPKVDHVQLDSAWAERLAALLRLGRVTVAVLATLLGFALAAITFNTIRLQILSQRDEIEVASLIGATRSFIRRPFLYQGAVQGLAGGLAAWLLLWLAGRGPADAFAEVLRVYGVSVAMRGLDLVPSLVLLGTAAALGWFGAWVSVTRHLAELKPR